MKKVERTFGFVGSILVGFFMGYQFGLVGIVGGAGLVCLFVSVYRED